MKRTLSLTHKHMQAWPCTPPVHGHAEVGGLVQTLRDRKEDGLGSRGHSHSAVPKHVFSGAQCTAHTPAEKHATHNALLFTTSHVLF